MFISDEEASARILSSTNLLSRVTRESSIPAVTEGPEPPMPDAPEEPVEEEKTQALTPEVVDDGFDTGGCILPDRKLRKRIAQLLFGNARGRVEDLSDEERAAIGAISNILTPRIAEQMFAVGEDHNAKLAHGIVNHQKGEVRDDLLDKIHGFQGSVADLAYKRLIHALKLIDEPSLDKLAEEKGARELAQVASQISKILSNTMPKDRPAEGNTVFHIYRPEMVQETHYEQVVVSKEQR